MSRYEVSDLSPFLTYIRANIRQFVAKLLQNQKVIEKYYSIDVCIISKHRFEIIFWKYREMSFYSVVGTWSLGLTFSFLEEDFVNPDQIINFLISPVRRKKCCKIKYHRKPGWGDQVKKILGA